MILMLKFTDKKIVLCKMQRIKIYKNVLNDRIFKLNLVNV